MLPMTDQRDKKACHPVKNRETLSNSEEKSGTVEGLLNHKLGMANPAVQSSEFAADDDLVTSAQTPRKPLK